jgi:flagellar hook-associated protein 3 FlgL
MTQRITHQMIARTVLADVNRSADRLAQTQSKLSSGREITRPSDDPYGTGRALSLRSELEGTRQHQRNVNDALAWQTVTDVALGTITDTVQRARELTVQGASDAAGPLARENIAAEIDQLVESVKQEASSSYGGRFVLAGSATQTRPYSPGVAGDAYAGDSSPIAREIGPGVSVVVNAVASDVLGSGQAAGDNRLLDVLRDIADHLRSGTVADGDALRTTDLSRLDDNLSEILRVRAGSGAIGNRLEAAGTRLAEVEETTGKLLSETEDADFAKTMVDFSLQQNAYQAALRSGANIVQASLLDFLR